MTIAERLSGLYARIDAACQRVGRSRNEVTLIGVAKGQPMERVKEAVSAGVVDIGENYAQEMLSHQEGVGKIRWHFIGHLQKNKVRQILPLTTLIHSVDSLPLAEEISKRATALAKVQPVLIEINLGNETSKGGVCGETEIFKLVAGMNRLSGILLKGLMAIPPLQSNPEAVRPFFRQLREIRDAMNQQNRYKEPLSELSIGMSSDFDLAIEAGATLVRIGTALFGERKG